MGTFTENIKEPSRERARSCKDDRFGLGQVKLKLQSTSSRCSRCMKSLLNFVSGRTSNLT